MFTTKSWSRAEQFYELELGGISIGTRNLLERALGLHPTVRLSTASQEASPRCPSAAMKCIQTLCITLLLQLLHASLGSAYSTSSTSLCRTLSGKSSRRSVPTENSFTTRPRTTRVVVRVTPTSTVTPSAVVATSTATSTVTSTTTVTQPGATSTVSESTTRTSTATSMVTSTVNVLVTVTTSTTSTSTIPAASGFVPINPDAPTQSLARRNVTAQSPAERAKLRIGAAPSFARTVYCTQSVILQTSTVRTSTARAVTQTASAPTSTTTSTATSTSLVTSMPSGAATTVTQTRTVDVTSTVTSTSTTAVTATATAVVTVEEDFYAQCAANNQLSIMDGNAYTFNPTITQTTVLVSSAYECCVACALTQNCGISYLFTGGTVCGLLSDGTCSADNTNIGNYDLVTGDPSVVLSNSGCGQWQRFL